MDATLPDLLRLLAVPVLGWAAIKDIETRRVPHEIWNPLLILGVILIIWEAIILEGPWRNIYFIRVLISVALVGGLSYLFHLTHSFGGADMAAFVSISILFPTYPTYIIFSTSFPIVETDIGVFSLTVLTNAVLLGIWYPLALFAYNLTKGKLSLLTFLAREVDVHTLSIRNGKLFDTDGEFKKSGLDLDALRMYLRWRKVDLETLRSNPELEDPRTLPEDPGDPTDGVIKETEIQNNSSLYTPTIPKSAIEGDDSVEDRWGAEEFLDDIDRSAYGTEAKVLRNGLDRIAESERVWVSPGIPFIVPTFLGLLLALTVGDVLFLGLHLLGIVG